MKALGRFISFEGIDGAGKSTQIAALEAALKARGIEVVLTREPGGTPLGEALRDVLLNRDMTLDAETLLFYAGRAEHVAKKIRPALASGAWVISDRFSDATYAYQVGGRGGDAARAEAIERWTLGEFKPDGTVLFDLDPKVAAARRAAARAADRFEALDTTFFERVRKAYLDRAAADAQRFLIVNAEETPDAIARQILAWTEAKWFTRG